MTPPSRASHDETPEVPDRTTRGEDAVVLDRAHLDALFAALGRRADAIVGPTVRDSAVVLDEIEGPDDLPAGVRDVQAPGSYRLEARDDAALFGWAVGPHSWKARLWPPRERLFRARREGNGFRVETDDAAPPRLAFLGVRPCELRAIEIQDRVFIRGESSDPGYAARRGRALVVVVQCTEPAATCFCASMGSGPGASSGFDLALTELLDDDGHRFLVEAASDEGRAVLAELPVRAAAPGETGTAARRIEAAAARQERSIETEGIRDLLLEERESPRWDDVAQRCLDCANCTLVCPTCFCVAVEDVTDLSGENAERWRRWDSCFHLAFSYMSGGSVRSTTRGRYRQWLTHKLATWYDQFGTSGCVGCGRCITWCPAAIDITEEAGAIRELRARREAGTASPDRPAEEGEAP